MLLFAGAGEPKIAMRVVPQNCLSPCEITITVTIPQREDNRYALVQVDGEELHSSIIQLEGNEAPRTHHVKYTVSTPGDYEVLAVLYNTTKEVARYGQTLVVK